MKLKVNFSNEFTPDNIVRRFSDGARNYEEDFSFTYQEKEELETRTEELEMKWRRS